MNKKILAAAIAAIALSGCTDQPPPSKKLHTASPVVAVPLEAEVQPIISAVAEPIPAVDTEASKRDAGSGLQLEAAARVTVPDDGLPLDHSHRAKVDHLARAIDLKETGDFDSALTEARRALFDDASDDQALRFITRVGKMLGQKEYVASAWGRISKLSSEDPIALVQQSRALVATGDFEGAVKIAREAAERDRTSAEPYQAMGRAYLAAGSLQEAIDSLHSAIELDPDHGYAMNNLGFAYLRANKNDQAVFILEKAAELLPHVAYVQNNLGVALERVKRMEEAKVAYQKAMDLSPKYVKARVNSDRIAKVARVSPEAVSNEVSDEVPVEATPIQVDQSADIPETFEE